MDDIFIVQRGTILKKIYDKQEFLRYQEKLLNKEFIEREESVLRIEEKEKESGFWWLDQSGNEQGFSVCAGEILFIRTEGWEEQQNLYRSLSGKGEQPSLYKEGERKIRYSALESLMKYKVAFWGKDFLEDELFAKLGVRDNILMPSVKRVSSCGFYKSGADFIFQDKEFLEESEELEKSGNLTDENMFKILCYRWKLFHPKVFIVHNILSRCDIKTKLWIEKELIDMAKRETAIILLEGAPEDVDGIEDREIRIYQQ